MSIYFFIVSRSLLLRPVSFLALCTAQVFGKIATVLTGTRRYNFNPNTDAARHNTQRYRETDGRHYNNNNNSLIYIAPYAELRRQNYRVECKEPMIAYCVQYDRLKIKYDNNCIAVKQVNKLTLGYEALGSSKISVTE